MGLDAESSAPFRMQLCFWFHEQIFSQPLQTNKYFFLFLTCKQTDAFISLHPATRCAAGLQPGGAVRGGAERHRWDFCHVPFQSPDPAEWIHRSGNVSHTADRESRFTSNARPLRAQVDAQTDSCAVASILIHHSKAKKSSTALKTGKPIDITVFVFNI